MTRMATWRWIPSCRVCSCIQNTSWANCFQARPNLQHDPAVHSIQDFVFTHWFGFNAPTRAAIFVPCTDEGDQLQWPSNWRHPQRGPAAWGLTLPQLVGNLTDHLTYHPIYIYSPSSMSIILQCDVFTCVCTVSQAVRMCAWLIIILYKNCVGSAKWHILL